MANIITNISQRSAEINAVKDIYMGLPDSYTDDNTAAALAARVFYDTRLFIGNSISDISRLTRKLCCDDDHGICIYQAYKLTHSLGRCLDLDHLKVIMFCILSDQPRDSLDLALLDVYADILSGSFKKVLPRRDDRGFDAGIIACALLTLTCQGKTDRYNFAYDTLIPAFEDCHRCDLETERDVAYALELLDRAENDLRAVYNDFDVYDIIEDPVLYRALLTAVLADFMGDDAYSLGNISFHDTSLTESLLGCKGCQEPDEHDPLDDLDWDSFFSYDE